MYGNTNVDYTEVVFTVDVKDVETAENIANFAVSGGIYIEDYTNLEENVEQIAHIDLIDEELLKKDRSKAKIHMYLDVTESVPEIISFISDQYRSQNIAFTVDTGLCKYEDWAENWKKYFKPLPIGEKLLIRPVWEPSPDNGRTEIVLEPGMAFGTGNHETTRLCLALLEKYVKSGDSILDVGCGSGILAIAGVKLGAQNAVGVDIDELSIKTANQNTILNKTEDKTTFIAGNLTDKISGKYSVVTANIVADIIIMLNKDIMNFLNPDSIYIMSGIIDLREQEVLDNLSSQFDILEIVRDRGWTAIAAKPHKAS